MLALEGFDAVRDAISFGDSIAKANRTGADTVWTKLFGEPTLIDGLSFLHLRPRALEAHVRRAILAGDLLLGHDEYAMRWISSYRADLVKGTSPPARRADET